MIFRALKKKSTKFLRAQWFCHLCEYHCDNLNKVSHLIVIKDIVDIQVILHFKMENAWIKMVHFQTVIEETVVSFFLSEKRWILPFFFLICINLPPKACYSLKRTWNYARSPFKEWYPHNKLIFMFFIIFVFVRILQDILFIKNVELKF